MAQDVRSFRLSTMCRDRRKEFSKTILDIRRGKRSVAYSRFTSQQVISWLNRYFSPKLHGPEAQFTCPKCGHENFYFNIKKLVGYCQRAKCRYRPAIQDLIDRIGVDPSQVAVRWVEPKLEIVTKSVVLPESCVPIVTKEKGELVTQFPDIVNILARDRFLSAQQLFTWNLQADLNQFRIVIPIWDQGVLVNYVSRAAWWLSEQNPKRYDYPKGHRITDNFLGWDEAQTWDHLTLVENTFNAIWLRDHLNCSTNFGSHLSDVQILKLKRSKIEHVTFLWDYGAEKAVDRARKKLALAGIPSTAVPLSKERPQPDDWVLEDLENLIESI